MPIAFTCPYCGAKKNVPDQYAGQSGPCAECGQMVTVPGAPMVTGPAKPAPPSSGGWWIVLAVLAVGAIALLACGGVLLALLVPAVTTSRGAARESMCQGHLKQIALALHNYHDTYKTFPAAYVPDENGRPMHSWRVAILPFLEQGHIFNQYNFNEPWDGPNNSQLAAMYPQIPVYRCPEDTLSGFDAPSYMAVVVPDGVFEGGKWNSIARITDGTSNTILVVEVTGANTHWMAPVDLDTQALNQMINSTRDGSGLSSNHPRGVNVAMADGAVITLTDATDLETLRKLVTKSDGAVVAIPQ
jgi:prepilin-type processing-associated H-X9-DG protein